MRDFSISEKARGELAVRRLSGKAQAYYNGDSLFTVYEYDTDCHMDEANCHVEPEVRYAYSYDSVCIDDCNLTLQQIDTTLCDYWNSVYDDLDEIEDRIAMLDRLDNRKDVAPEYYEDLCNELGLAYHSYDDPGLLWADILEKANKKD